MLICLNFDYSFCNGDYFCHCKPCSKERYNRDLVVWQRKWDRAKAENDYEAMDILDKKFEMVGMP